MVRSQTRTDPAERMRMEEALTAALGRLACVSAELCVKYMEALATDQDRWQRHISQIRGQRMLSRAEAINSLTVRGETPLTWHTTKTIAARDPGSARH
jgi:hypothetical protein